MINQPFLNPSGYMVKNCVECKRDFNINSFSKIDPNLCIICYEDINDVKVWNFTDGDYNDVFNIKTIKGTGKQINKFVLSHFDEYNQEDIEDMNTDSIGYWVLFTDHDEIRTQYYAEAREIEDYNEDKDGKIYIDLTNEENNNGA